MLQRSKLQIKIVSPVFNLFPISELEFYHVMDGLLSCISHDLFGGIVERVLSLVSKTLVREKHFTLDYLNSQLCSFNYCDVDRANKPSAVPQTIYNCKLLSLERNGYFFVRCLHADVLQNLFQSRTYQRGF